LGGCNRVWSAAERSVHDGRMLRRYGAPMAALAAMITGCRRWQ